MDNLINKISEIEAAASSVLDNMNERKAAFAAEIKEKTAAFDASLEQETAEAIHQLRERMETEMKEKLSKQKADGEKALSKLDEIYESSHAALAAKLFRQMTKE
ncbi:MAG: ATPase [Lachnospiraceae bacterium]|nr:ATPase [Lachnospiraceae bacterium]